MEIQRDVFMKKNSIIMLILLFIVLSIPQFKSAQYPSAPWESISICVRGNCISTLYQIYFIVPISWRLSIGCEGDGGYWSGSGSWPGSFAGCDRLFKF